METRLRRLPLRERDPDGFAEFTAQDYLDYVDGRAPHRRCAHLPRLPRHHRRRGDSRVGTGRQRCSWPRWHRRGHPLPGSVRYLEAAREAGLRIAVVTSSKMESRARAADPDQVRRDPRRRTRCTARGLNGKPAPDSFLLGAELMDVPARPRGRLRRRHLRCDSRRRR